MASFKFINTFSLLFSLFSMMTAMGSSPQYVNGCSTSEQGPIIPTTPLVTFLEKVQETALNTFGPKGFDPKLYVDLSLKFDLATTKQAFDSLSRTQNGSVLGSEFNGFLEGYLEGADEDLVYVEPVDFVDEPVGFLPKVENQEMRDWALEVHSLWKNLSRKVSDRVLEKPNLHTLLPMQNPVIIPGSRFREVYYWDSYWVIRGLLTSKMYETAKGIVINLIALIDEYGHVLNGARAYYTNRSQPPLLSSMVFDIYNRTDDMDLVRKSLPALLKEHKFWNTGKHMVTIVDAQGSTHNLSRYYAMWNEPRPESSTTTTEKAECIEVLYSSAIRTQDKETAQNISDVCERQHLYRELASTAESGWDFSTRWMRNGSDLTTLATTSILPVDLNAFILKMELDIAFLANVAGDSDTALQFREASQARQKAINSVFWDAEKGQWFDYWLDDSVMSKDVYKLDASYRSQDIFASNFMPLWIQLFNTDGSVVEKVAQSLQSSGLVHAVGIATSLKASGQQWDFPNGWAPIQHTIVEGLVRSESEEARSLAKDIAISWIRTNYVAFKMSGAMHEKYDVQKCGEFGGGGEYKPQTGFGWSNGVVLAFLEEFGWSQDLKLDC